MKILVENYTFNAATKQIVFSDYTSISLESVLLITNVTDNIIIYNFADPSKGGTVAGNVLTLDYDTVSMSNGDSLQIFIENGEIPASESTTLELKDLLEFIKILVNQTKTLATQDAAQRQRVNVDFFPPNISVNAVDAFNILAFSRGRNAFDAQFAVPDVWNTIELSRINYQTSIRPKLIF